MTEHQKTAVIDANILLRFLLDDQPEQAAGSVRLLKRLEDGLELALLPDLALADVVWTLEKFYRQPKARIRELLLPIISLRGLQCSSKPTIREALLLYAEKNLDWTDSFLAALMLASGRKIIYSYDHDFDRIVGIRRIQP